MTATPTETEEQDMSQQQTSPAQAYEDYYGPAIFEPLAQIVLGHALPSPGERVLDVACGTGIVARRVAAAVGSGGSVVGVDVNPAMVEVAATLSDGLPIEWREGDGTALDLPDASFDLVLCQQGLQFFPDRAAGAGHMRRVLADGGRAVVATWHGLDRHPLYEAMADAEEPHLAALGAQVSRAQLEAPFSLGAEELAALLTDAGFTTVELAEGSIDASFADPDRFVERMQLAYAAVIPQMTEDPAAFQRYLEAVGQETEAMVETYWRGDRVVVPMHTAIAIAHV